MAADVSSPENVSHVVTLCHRFLTETYKVQLDADALVHMVHDAIRSLPPLPIGDANKAIIVAIKDRVLTQPAQQQPAVANPGSNLQKMFAVSYDNNEDEFFKKLQDLESHRAIAKPNKPPISPLTEPSRTELRMGPEQSIVYLPNTAIPPRINKPVVINGSDRMWEYFTKRSTLVWIGPIPHSSPNVRFEHILLPSECSAQTPVVTVNIKGAAGNSVSSICIKTSAGNTWDTWTPCATVASGAYLKALACPWTIKLTDNFGQPLDMGNDAGVIATTTRLMNKNTKVTFKTPENIRKGDVLLIKKSNPDIIIKMKVINYDPDNMAAELPPLTPPTDLTGAKVCNLHYQATMIISLLSD